MISLAFQFQKMSKKSSRKQTISQHFFFQHFREIIYSLKRNTENGSVWDSIELDIENDLKDENLDEKIRKKIDLAKHIRSTRVPNELLEKTKNIDSELWNEDVVFIDKFMNSISANIFRFSNKSIQVRKERRKIYFISFFV